ncbi:MULTISPECIES: ABC transporter substrate-binding protein [Coprococcus]|uniref:ABC transporter substrate-binding protein n=1 Tax=Coprococcus TaxID=33042 RepID=UPI000E740F32|nr:MULTISPECIES: ABC transporter substrate-binding protein [Coprococcus]MBD9291110.1 carbohydrate ABC transporter substrate-binding protein [Coprococcus eutactus]RJW77393.1 carbohydrate ABC transporter substrate-binding protein [Coprococcus sp. AF38-1]
MGRINIFLLLAAVMIICCGCAGTSGDEEVVKELSEYQMTQLNVAEVYGIGKTQDGYVCIGENSDGEAVKLTFTSPNGEVQEEKLDSAFVMSVDEKISAAYVDGDGSIYIALSSVLGDGDMESRIAVITGNGEVRQLSDEFEGNVTAIRVLADGSGYISGCPGGDIRCFSMDGEERFVIKNMNYTDICVASDRIMVLTERSLLSYDISDGSETENITAFDKSMADDLDETFNEKGMDAVSCRNIMKYDEDSDSLYLMLSTGLYEYKLKDRLGIRLATFRDSDIEYDYVVEGGDTFVAIAGGKSGRKYVVVYSYDSGYASAEDKEEMGDNEVTLYSLYYAESYETLISWYEEYHSDMTVKYTWGIDDDNGISESDAIRALNTQLLAGEGPDVIIMDGLNVGSYEDTGVLLELSQVYDDILEENSDCLENVLNTYRKEDGSIYAIPSMETFTAIIGPEKEVKNMMDVQSLAAYISSQDRPKYGNDLSFYNWECYFDILYSGYASEIVDSNGNYDEEMLRKFLEDLKLLYDTEMERTTQDQIDEWSATWGTYSDQIKKAINSEYMSPLFNSAWSGRKTAFVNMKTMGESWRFYSIKEDYEVGTGESGENTDYAYEIWGNGGGKVFVPNTVVAINSRSKSLDQAISFMKDLFSTDVQKIYYGVECGNPVNMEGVREWNREAQSMGTPGGKITLGGNDYMDWSYWRKDEYLEDYIDKLRELDTPSNTDARVRSVIRDNVGDYLENGDSLDSTVNSIDKLLGVYLSE